MTDAEVIEAIRKIIHGRVRLKGADKRSVEARDLARYDQIVGLITRHVPSAAPKRPRVDVTTLGDARKVTIAAPAHVHTDAVGTTGGKVTVSQDKP